MENVSYIWAISESQFVSLLKAGHSKKISKEKEDKYLS